MNTVDSQSHPSPAGGGEAKRRPVTEVAHDLNNAAATILGSVEVVRRSLGPALDKDPALRPCLTQIEEAAERTATLARELSAHRDKT